MCIIKYFLKIIKIFLNPKKGTLCFGHLCTENYICDNIVSIEGSKHGIVTIEKPGR